MVTSLRGTRRPENHLTRRWATLALALLAAGCADQPPAPPSGVSVVDSAGVRIVENGSTRADPSALRLTADPLFRVGWGPDEPNFRLIFTGAIMGHDRVAVSDVARVHVLSMSGEALYSVGGEGEGPGEFRAVYSIVSAGADTLIMHDYEQGRVTTFAGQSVVGTARVVPPTVDHRHVVRGRGPEGELILVPTGYLRVDGPPNEWLPVAILRHGDGVGEMDTIARLDFQKRRNGGLISPMGWSALSETMLIHVRGDRPEVRWYDLDGELLQIGRWRSRAREVDDAFWDWLEDEAGKIPRYREMSDADFRERLSVWREAAEGVEERVPVYSRLFSDASGNVWMGEWTPFNSPPRRYSLIGADGIFAGSLEVPSGFRPIAFGEDLVLGYELNELDVPAATAYRIERGPS